MQPPAEAMIPKWCQWEPRPRKDYRIQWYVKKGFEIMKHGIRIRFYISSIYFFFTVNHQGVWGEEGDVTLENHMVLWFPSQNFAYWMFTESSDILSVCSCHPEKLWPSTNQISKQAQGKRKQLTSRLVISNLNLEGGTWEVPLMQLDSSAHRMSRVVSEIEFSVSARGREDIHSIFG